ncbi:hypothetical protein [Microvirga terrestris]|uniref:Uncharacterized protein n=1 Tax=Microvirga terrestris TaxID=2791024 RepID=A0ABS0HYG4_9HYPH|nr:hypothetical protein [Microvirga terrestris]MBF9198167.1 hypothetical protein [Microvirga terrestris]
MIVYQGWRWQSDLGHYDPTKATGILMVRPQKRIVIRQQRRTATPVTMKELAIGGAMILDAAEL